MDSKRVEKAVFVVFSVLVAATTTMWWVGEHHWMSRRSSAIFLFVVAFLKIRLVMLYFMELRSAPTAWRLIFDAWCIACCVWLSALYMQGVHL